MFTYQQRRRYTDLGQRRYVTKDSMSPWSDFSIDNQGICECEMCTSTEIKIRQAKTEDKLLEIRIGYSTSEVKVQVMAGTKAITKVNTIWVTPDTEATADLVSSKLFSSLGCKVRKDHGEQIPNKGS